MLAVAPGADDIHRIRRRTHGHAFGAHHGGGGGVFVHRFAAGAQGHQKAADLGGGRVTGEEDGKGRLGLSAG